MPVGGHWHMRHRVDEYLERRSQEVDSAEPGVHVLTPQRAVEEWKRLEPQPSATSGPCCTTSSVARGPASRSWTPTSAGRPASAG